MTRPLNNVRELLAGRPVAPVARRMSNDKGAVNNYALLAKKIRSVLLLFSGVFVLTASSALSVEGINPTTPKSLVELEDMNLVRGLFEDKRYDFAAKEADNYLKKHPEGRFVAEILFIRAQIYVINEFFNSALFNYNQIIKKYPESDYYQDALYFSGVLAFELGEKKTAEYYLQRLKKTFPQSKYNSKLEHHFGKIAFKKKKWKAAEEKFESSLKNSTLTKKRKLEAKNYLAWSRYFQGKKKSAGKMFRKLLDSDIQPYFKARISFQLGQDAYQENKYKVAAFWWEKLLKKWPHPAFRNKAVFWLAETLYLIHKQSPSELPLQQTEKAIRLYSENLSLERPLEAFVSHYHRAWFFLAVNKPDKAEHDFEWLLKNRAGHKGDIDADLLGSGIIRAYRKRNDCRSVLNFQNNVLFDEAMKKSDVIRYYAGKCHLKQKRWSKAKRNFSQISLKSKFGALILSDYLEIFRQTNDFVGGLQFLKKASENPAIEPGKILMSKAEFCLKLKRWLMAAESMEQIMQIAPRNKKDPWFLLDLAKIYRQVVNAYANKKWRQSYSQLKPLKFYKRQTAYYYEKSYGYLSERETKTKLSTLAFLTKYYEKEKKFRKAMFFYKKALPLIKDQERKNGLELRIAEILIDPLKKIQEAKVRLRRLHNKGDKETNYEASSILAEILIKEKRYSQAIKTLEELSGQPINKTRSAKVHYRLGELYQFKEEWRKAVYYYEMVVKGTSDQLKKQAQEHLTNIERYLEQLKAAKDAS